MLAPLACWWLRRLTFELSRPWRQGPLADRSNIVLGSGRPVGLAGAGRLERRVRPQRTSIWTKPAVVPSYRQSKRPGVASPTRKDSLHGFGQEFPLVAASDEQHGVAIAIAEGFAFAFSSNRLSGPSGCEQETCFGCLSCGAAVRRSSCQPAANRPLWLSRWAAMPDKAERLPRDNSALASGDRVTTDRSIAFTTFAFDDRCFLRPNV
jgi:hypothetical protein